jgi:chromosome segregation ATPase
MDDDELRQLSKEDLIEVFKQLSNDLDDKEADLQERDDHIQNLEQELMKLTRRMDKAGGGGDGMDEVLNAAALETENQDLREKLESTEKELKQWREKAGTLQSHNKVLEGAKGESDGLVKTLRKQLDGLKMDLDKEVEKSKASMRKSQDVSRQKQDTQKQQLQLYEENEQLQKDNQRLSEQVGGLQENRVLLEALITKLADEKDGLQIEKESVEIGQDALSDRIEELERDLEAAQDKVSRCPQLITLTHFPSFLLLCCVIFTAARSAPVRQPVGQRTGEAAAGVYG